MGSSSAIAAAVALTAASSPAFAQGVPGGSGPGATGSGSHVTAQDRFEARRAGRSGRNIGRNIRGDVRAIPREVPNIADLPTFNGNPVAVPVQTQVNIGAAPTIPAIQVPATVQADPLQRAEPVERAINAAPGEAGINVRAFAQFDDVQIDFNPGTAVDEVNVLASSAIINWTTFDSGASGTEVTFLGVGDNLQFTSSLGDYTVLNRVLTPGFDSAIRIDGDIDSSVFGSTTTTGGNIWFYSAGGIVVGDQGSFNVGSLLLSTSDIDPADVTNGAFDVTFTGTPDSNSAIRIDGGATLRANNSGSYIALVAPRIEQNGTVTANGSVAYVAAEQATMTIENGLFDISVAVGTEDANGIVHGETGSTGGASSTGVTDEQAIYFVAVPKNDAITMLVGGSIGYDPASSASIRNGQIILTTGDRVERQTNNVFISGIGFVDVSSNTVDTSVNGGPAGSVTIESVELTSSTDVFAEGSITLQAGVTNAADNVTVDSGDGAATNLNLTAGDSVDVNVTANGRINVSGSLNLTAGDGAGNGGTIDVNVDAAGALVGLGGGTLSTGGNLSINTAGRGLDDDNDLIFDNGGLGIAGDGVGGDISLDLSNNGVISIGGSLDLDASANGGRGFFQHGSATAGSIEINVADGTASILGSIALDAGANLAGTRVLTGSAEEGSDSTAGNVTINLTGGSIDANFLGVNVNANATGGTDSTIVQSNDAAAGDFTFNVTGGSHSFSGIGVDATATSGRSFDGTTGTLAVGGLVDRGSVSVAVSNADTALSVASSVFIDVTARGNAGAAVGDTVSISVIDTGTAPGAGLVIGGDLDIFASLREGAPGALSEAGTIRLSADNGVLEADGVTLRANAFLPALSSSFDRQGTDFQGGVIDLTASNGGSISIDGSSFISATATGGANSSDAGLGIGQGGAITLLADDGSITFNGDLDLEANGLAFSGTNSEGVSGQGLGGTVRITVQGAGGSMTFQDIDAGTDGTFSFDGEVLDTFFVGAGTGGVGGLTEFNVLGGTLSATDITVSSDGEGGPGGEVSDGSVGANGLLNTGEGGLGTGGEVVFNLDGGDATVTNLTVTSSGIGGDGAFGSAFEGTNAGDGGDAVGGTATFNALSGNLTVTNTLSVEATGNRQFFGRNFGGDGGNARGTLGGAGGSSTGGNAVFNLEGSAVVDALAVVVSTQAFGGDGGDSDADFSGNPDQDSGVGGNATGGNALFNDTAGDITFGTLTVNASGQGGTGGSSAGNTTGDAVGTGGAGGMGTGGTALISLNQDDADAKNYSVISQGIGGVGGQGAVGGAGGMGMAGIAELAINDVSVVFDVLSIDATAIGGNGGFIDGQIVADGADGGDSEGGEARLVVAGANADFQANSSVALNSGATGGTGRDGSFSFDDERDAGAGGIGGSATGGSSTIIVRDNADINIDAVSFVFNSDSTGGSGGDGGDNLGAFTGRPTASDVPITSTSGAGGAGGSGTAGSIGIVATSGANVVISGGSGPLILAAIGSGGNGGEGGLGSSRATVAGDGGEGGAGIGGSPSLSANGASITIDDITLVALGGGGVAGDGGDNDVGGPSGSGANGGIGVGGTPLIELTGGSGGEITLGNVTILANGTGGAGTRSASDGIGGGGQVTIRDTSVDPTGINVFDIFGDLTIDATGDAASDSGVITIAASNVTNIVIDGALTADVTGQMDFIFADDGRIDVFGNTALTATSGINVIRPDAALDDRIVFRTDGTFTALVTAGDFNASANAEIRSERFVSITAENVNHGAILSELSTSITATNGDISSNRLIFASAVNDAIILTATGDVTFGILDNVDGDPATRDGNININAGGNIFGGRATSGQTINLNAGRLVSVITVDTSATNVGTVTINAGTIDLGTLNARFISNLTSDTGDLAIDTILGGTSVSLDSAANIVIGTADTSGFSAEALSGNITIGSLTTTGVSDIRLNADGDIRYDTIDASRLVALNSDTITGGDLVAAAGIDLTAGSIDIGDTRSTGGFVLITSTTGDLSAGAITADVFGTTVDSAGSATLGDISTNGTTRINSVGNAIVGDINANNSAVIDAGGNITAGDLSTGGGITLTASGDADVASAAANGGLTVNVDGALSGGDFVGQGPLSLVTVNAGSVDIGSVVSINQTLTVTTSGAAVIGNATSGVSTTITGASVTLDSGDVGATLRVTSNVGDITGLGSITVGGSAIFNAAANIGIGTLEANNIALTSAGDLRFNGLTSPNSIVLTALTGEIGATTPGLGDINSGGLVDLTSETMALGDINSDGSITADATDGDASFGALTAGTFITINAKGSPSVESVTSVGNVILTGASIALDGGDIGGSLLLDAQAGDITLSFDGAQQLLVGSGATFNATGDMIVTHTNNAANTISIDVGSSVRADVGGSFNSGPGSILNAQGEMLISADGDITANDLRSAPGIILNAGGNVLLNNATATGPQGVSNFRGIVVQAGLFDLGSGLFVFDNIATATITGDVTSYADIDITAGGNAVFAAGSNTAADNALTVNTGDDIIVEAGALLSSANNPTDAINPLDPFTAGPNLTLNAGGEQNLLSIPVTPIASLVMDGTLDANDGAIILLASAIEGLDSTLIAGSIQVDLRDAPASTAFLSDDDGLLSGPCLEGIVCLGDMDATGRIEIGQNSNNDVIQLFVQQATISATDILITTRNDIVMGTNGIDTVLNATGIFSATSNTGNVELNDASIAADQILIDAAGSVLGTGVLSSANDIGITVGDSIIVGGIITDGELTEVADVGGAIEGFYSVDGSFVAGVFSQGSSDIDLSAGDTINIGEASSPDSIFLSAIDVFLGLASVPGDIIIDGSSIGFDSLDAGSTISLSGGGVFGGDLFSGEVTVEGDQINIGNVDAATTASIIGSSIAVGEVRADDIALTSDTDILFNLLQSTNAIDVSAADGQIAANTGSGDIISDGDVTLAAQDIAIGNVTSLGSVTADASAGDATFGVVDAATDITITATGSPSVLNAISGGDTTITGASVTFDNGTIGGDLSLNATDGDIDGNGAVSVDGGIEFTATGDVGFGSLAAAGGSFVVDAGGDLAFVSATSTDFIDLIAGGAVNGGNLNATNAVSVDADSIAVGDVLADQIDLNSATDILFNLIQSPNAISLTATSGLIGVNTGPGDIISGGDVTLLAEFIDVNQIDAGGAVTATATGSAGGTGGGSGGPVVIGGGNDAAINTANITSGGVVTLTAVDGPIVTGDIDAASNVIANGGTSVSTGSITGEDIALTANDGSLSVDGTIAGQQGVTLTASEDVSSGDIDAGSSVEITGMALTLDTVTAGAAITASGTTISFSEIDAGTNASLFASNGALDGASVSAGDTATLEAGDGGITLEILDAGDADLLASGAVAIDDAIIGALLTAEGTAIDIASSGNLSVDVTATDGDISVLAQQTLGVEFASATGDIMFATDMGGMRVVDASGQNIVLVSEGNVEIAGTVDAVDALSVDAVTDFTVSGSATAQTIEVTSGDVSITPDGRVGDATRTQSITFNTLGDVTVGGDGTDAPPPYQIDNFEFSRIFSGGDIVINAFADGSSADAILTVGTLDLIAGDGSNATGQNIGQNGAFIVNADGDITIIGNATITGASADTEFAANAINLIRLNTQAGGIFMLDANGGLAGTISIAATDFIATTDAAFADIQGLSVADVDLRLAESDGVDRPDGVIRADTLDVATTASQVFIQNTVPGVDFDQRRGFDVNTLSIQSGGGTGSLQPIVVNGVIGGVTGFDAIPLANILSAIDPASTINGCVINDPASCVPTGGGPITPGGGPTTPTPTDPDEPSGGSTEIETRDLIDEGLDPEQTIQSGTIEGGLIELRPDSAFAADPLIDDPVTGAGNEDLWVSDEEECEDEGGCDTEAGE
jgi:hypothetical protein